MANEENLKGNGFDKRTTEELREITKRGGQRSGEARRKKANFRKTLNMLLTSKIDSPEWTPMLEAMGLDPTLESAVNAAMIKRALEGDVKAFEAIAKYSGQSDKTESDDIEQSIRTDRAKQARDQEVGDTTAADDNIKSFLKAMNPTKEELDNLFEEETNGEETESTE